MLIKLSIIEELYFIKGYNYVIINKEKTINLNTIKAKNLMMENIGLLMVTVL